MKTNNNGQTHLSVVPETEAFICFKQLNYLLTYTHIYKQAVLVPDNTKNDHDLMSILLTLLFPQNAIY